MAKGLVLLAFVVAVVAESFMPPNQRWAQRKRRSTSTRDADDASSSSYSVLLDVQQRLERLQGIVTSAFSPAVPEGCFDMQDASARGRLIRWLWRGDYSACQTEVLAANPELETQLQQRTRNRYTPTDSETHAVKRRGRLNFLAGLMVRNKSKNVMPGHHVLLAIESKHKMMNRALWDTLTQIRVLPSYNWTDDLISDAVKENPGCPYAVLDYCTAAVFDNYTTHQNYSAAHTADTQGQRLDMTNWASLSLPHSSAPKLTFSSRVLSRPFAEMFKPDFDKYSVVDLCHPYHPDLVDYKRRRWMQSVERIVNGTFFHRPTYTPPVAHHIFYQPLMPGVLQSSYVDVEYELDVMRGDPRHRHSAFVFVGGDGLAIMRINWTLARKPTMYLRNAPAVIPVQGEHPHGTCHICHMGWRPYWPLLEGLLRKIR